MLTLRPFRGYLVAPERVRDVVAPAYDALTPGQRYLFARSHPDNYVNVIRSLYDFPECERPTLDEVLESNKRKLEELLAQGVFREMASPCLFVYRLKTGDHEQVGLVGEIPVDEYDRGVIKKHEHTHTTREDHLVRYNDVVGAASSPVCLAYPHQPEVDAIVRHCMEGTPVIDFVARDGVAQTIWCIDDSGVQERLLRCFAGIGEAYLTDGHHRAAAASRFAQLRRQHNPHHTGQEAYNYLLAVLFPDDQMRILAYNRYVKDLNGLTPGELLDALSRDFTVTSLGAVPAGRAEPLKPREFSMLLEGQWYRLDIEPDMVPEDDPVASLDITILHDRILAPILGVVDLRCNARCESIAGVLGMEGLVEHCAAGGVAFACYPMSIEELMAVADADRVMPPKSTWFDPKAHPGLFLLLR